MRWVARQIKTPPGIGRRFESVVQRLLTAILHQNSKLSIPVAGDRSRRVCATAAATPNGRAHFGAVGIAPNNCAFLSTTGRFDRIGGGAEHAVRHLHRAGPLQMVHALEGGGDRTADGERAVIAQQHVVLVAESCCSRGPRHGPARCLHSRDRRDHGWTNCAVWFIGSRPSMQLATAVPSAVCR